MPNVPLDWIPKMGHQQVDLPHSQRHLTKYWILFSMQESVAGIIKLKMIPVCAEEWFSKMIHSFICFRMYLFAMKRLRDWSFLMCISHPLRLSIPSNGFLVTSIRFERCLRTVMNPKKWSAANTDGDQIFSAERQNKWMWQSHQNSNVSFYFRSANILCIVPHVAAQEDADPLNAIDK